MHKTKILVIATSGKKGFYQSVLMFFCLNTAVSFLFLVFADREVPLPVQRNVSCSVNCTQGRRSACFI